MTFKKMQGIILTMVLIFGLVSNHVVASAIEPEDAPNVLETEIVAPTEEVSTDLDLDTDLAEEKLARTETTVLHIGTHETSN